jgi:excisionase family DNA binding protein
MRSDWWLGGPDRVQIWVPERRASRVRTPMDAPHGVGRLLTAAEVAERLGYSERYVWRLGREGVLPRVKLPGRKYVRFCEADVQRLIEHSRDTAPPPVRAAAASRSPVGLRLPRRF